LQSLRYHGNDWCGILENTMTVALPAALLYDDSAYVETLTTTRPTGGERPVALVGRQVAGCEFLDAYLSHGDFQELHAVVWNQASANTLADRCKNHPRASLHKLLIASVDQFLERSGPAAAPLLYTPCPPDPSFAWLRYERGPTAFSLSGVTHTLSTAGVARVLCDLLTAPYEPYDALICTSAAVMKMVRSATTAYADYLDERFGCKLSLRPRLEQIPLGVNPERFRPATATERAVQRARLNIRPDAVAVLFVGRFTPHAKAHPFAMFQGLARAARSTGQPVHIILSGWAAHDDQRRIFLDGLNAFAPGIPVSVVNGLDPDLRFDVWKAADVFTSLADSIQETFGLVVIEAMACGLPVVATDWDGYRDLVVDGTTGFLVPTCMVPGATVDTTMRLLLGVVDYDTFLGECNQAVAVDPDAAAMHYGRLLAEPALRQQMGWAGRQRVERNFTWERIVKAYERLWREQEKERQAHSRVAPRPRQFPGPPCFPAPEVSFAGYPTALLDDDELLFAAPKALERLGQIMQMPLCSYAGQRIQNEVSLSHVLKEATKPCSLGELTQFLVKNGSRLGTARSTLAWLLKYGLLGRGKTGSE
jgi:glycosyltransferase involved in cell wall biosynthesis